MHISTALILSVKQQSCFSSITEMLFLFFISFYFHLLLHLTAVKLSSINLLAQMFYIRNHLAKLHNPSSPDRLFHFKYYIIIF